uniref:ATP-dependent translocase ABCB1-like n=1 Tax=Styela clava TaxID=7725 RepID=UPI0019398226|nr:ATP-dependent translocase ABCB1-like [Styela clava]
MENRRLIDDGDYIDDTIDVEVRDPASSRSTSQKEKESVKSVPYYRLYRYADCLDVFMIILGTITSIVHGTGLPLLNIFFGTITNSLTEYGKFQTCHFNYTMCINMGLYNGTETQFDKDAAKAEDLEGNAVASIVYLAYIGAGVFVCASLQVGTFCFQASRQTNKLRVEYVRSVLRQDIGYHDLNSSGEINSRLSDDIKKIYDGMADKLSISIQNLAMIGAGTTIAFLHSWKLSLATLAVAPLIVIWTALVFRLTVKYTAKELDAYAGAGSVAEETISAIRTVVAFGIQEECQERYSSKLKEAKVMGIKKGFVTGLSLGFLYFSMFSMYAISFWYGIVLILDPNEDLNAGDMVVVFFNILMAAFALGTIGSNMEYFSSAKAAAYKVFEVVDRVPPIDIFSSEGLKPDIKDGEITFKNVRFCYPSRPEVEVLKGISFTVEKGQTVALVGQSGCGKSTCVSLIQRFYDVALGSVEIEGVNVRHINVKWLRDKIGVVAQEPVLFNTTIAENIRWGREGVTQAEIIRAARQANALDFINSLPKRFDTLVGESGGQMSGGQKQRIAIARAIVRDPKVMLLDEATSALDTESESIVQVALDKAAAGRTTIVIAHRLATIRNADKIVVFDGGEIVEVGTHAELMQIDEGVYANLINMQTVNTDKNAISPIPEDGAHRTLHTQVSVKSARKLRRRMSSMSSASSHPDHDVYEDGETEIEEEEEEDLPDASIKRMLILNRPEWCYIIFGCFFAFIAGSIDALTSLIFPQVFTIFTIGGKEQQLHQAMIYAMMFLGLGGLALLSYTTEGGLFSKSGMELTTRLRKIAFKTMLRQDISYFDDHRHSTGALATRLATDASRVQGCTGIRLGSILKNLSALGVSIGIGFAFGWKLTLVSLAFIPFVIVGGFLEMSLLVGEGEKEKQAFEDAGRIVSEATQNIRTVASLTKEETICLLYKQRLKVPARNANKKALITGLGYGFAQCVFYFGYAGILRYGVFLVGKNEMEFENVFRVLFAIIFGAMSAGQNSSFAPDYAEGKVSAKRMFKLFDSVPSIDIYDENGHEPHNCKGNIEFRSVQFTYPTRPDLLVLKGCDFQVPSGCTLALVGQSGCGKSTCIQLIERFYDAVEGEVTQDACDVKNLRVTWLRQQIGIVSQEPVLFDMTIKENILFGDRTRSYTDDEVKTAAVNANIHDFITSLPEGYETKVGAKGGQLSGGQKQRIAIARALLRKPTILLLDEATSALDTESEKIVQDALDKAREGRTCIIVAHRLSTVKNADIIAVVDNGQIVETGTHEALIKRRGAYYSLVNAQLTHKEEE